MFIYRRRGGLTAKKLAELCNARTSRKYLPRYRDFIVNYGQQTDRANLNRNVIYNKLEVLNILKDNGIAVPKVIMNREDIQEEDFPILARRKYHSQGRDIIYIHNRKQLDNEIEDFMYDYFVEYIPKKSEYRVHIFRDYGVMVSVKVNKEGDGDPIVRSHKNKWRQISYEGEYYDELVELGKRVIDILGYDFGAIDIIRKGTELYVLEINTAPGLEPRKLQVYADYFREMERRYYDR